MLLLTMEFAKSNCYKLDLKYLYLEVQETDQFVLSKIGNLDKKTNVKLLIKNMLSTKLSMKKRKVEIHIIIKLDKLKKIYEKTMQNKNDDFLKIELEVKTGRKPILLGETKQ